jgi:hypothetical protein
MTGEHPGSRNVKFGGLISTQHSALLGVFSLVMTLVSSTVSKK